MLTLVYFLTFTLSFHAATKPSESLFTDLATRCTIHYSQISEDPWHNPFVVSTLAKILNLIVPTALSPIIISYLQNEYYHAYKLLNFQSHKHCTALASHYSNNCIAYGDSYGNVGILNIKHYQHQYYQTPGLDYNAYISAIVFSPRHNQLAGVSSDSTIKIWNLANQSAPLHVLAHNNPIQHIAWSPCGLKIASAGYCKKATYVYLWDTIRGRPENIYEISNILHGLTWKSTCVLVALSKSNLSNFFIANLNTMTCSKEFLGHTKQVNKVIWSPNHNYIASTSYDNLLRVWDSTTGKHICKTFAAPDSDMVWSPCNKFIAITTPASTNPFSAPKILNVADHVIHRCNTPIHKTSSLYNTLAAWLPDSSLCIGNEFGTIFIAPRKTIYDITGGNKLTNMHCKSRQHKGE